MEEIKTGSCLTLLVIALICSVLVFTGLIPVETQTGRLLFGSILVLVGIGWIGIYFIQKMKSKN